MHILIVDDHQDARIILKKTLESRGHFVTEAAHGKEALETARQDRPEMIVSDILMPVMDGFSLCREVRRDPVLKKIPFIFYTATYVDDRDEKLALELGADGFIRKPADPEDFITAITQAAGTAKKRRSQKDLPDPMDDPSYFKLYNERLILKLEKKMMELERKSLALEREITQRRQVEAELSLFRILANHSNDAYFVTNTDSGRLFDVNLRACENLGYDRKELLEKKITDIETTMPDLKSWQQVVAKAKKTGSIMRQAIHRRKDGREFPVEISAKIVNHQDKEYAVAIARDIRERKKAEQAVTEMRERHHALVASSADHIFMLDLNGVYIETNDRTDAFLLESSDALIGKSVFEVHDPLTGDLYREKMDAVMRTRSAVRFEYAMTGSDGKRIEHEDTLYPIFRQGELRAVGGICRDITEHKRLESQLRHVQKMNAIGRLAGGVAHDFNNMLSIITGFADLTLDHLSPSDPLYENIKEILNAADRSAAITRQLLAFARKQTVSPQVIDLGQMISESLKMLGRLIGEDIELRFHPGENLWPVLMDPSQMDQVLANLSVNARDAIDGVGVISIETKNMTLDDAYCWHHPECTPGEYVMLTFSDSGTGMDPETKEKVFEPFFTTKGEGKGTGLGLSTVFGIIKQNGGFVNLYSEPGAGTTFTIYLPRHTGADRKIAKQDKSVPLTGTETILLVEDEQQILKLCTKIMEQKGYTVIPACLPGEAIVLCEKYDRKIHLLITDVVMPDMDGRELKERIEALQPGIRTLFMSGYTADIIARRGILKQGVHFIHKPFQVSDLCMKVRQALDGG